MSPPAMTGVVLAGGASTRMGRDKATLRIGGVRLVDRAIATLREVCGEVWVAARDHELPDLGVPLLADADGEGPLAGIVAALERATTPLLAALAVDMPSAQAAVFSRLAQEWAGEAGVAPVVDGVVQPLHAVYATGFAGEYAALLAAGERSPRRALMAMDARLAGPAIWGFSGVSADFTRSLNTAEEFARWSSARE